MTELAAILVTAHRANVRRYKRLLRTQLTDLERSFVLRRIDEENSALRDLLRKQASAQPQPFPVHVPAAAASGAEAT